MNCSLFFVLLGFALLTPHFIVAQDGEAVAYDLAKYWAGRARQYGAIKQHQALLRHRRAAAAARRKAIVPPWIKYKEEGGEQTEEGAEGEVSTDSAEQVNANGNKPLTLEDMQLWSSIDLDKNGKLTISEFDRFVRSPSARAFVNRMKSEKAVKEWADRMGIDVAKAKQAIAMGANSQAYRNRAMAIQNARRQQAMQQARLNQRRAVQSRQNNYFANLGRQYYKAMSRGRRDEL